MAVGRHKPATGTITCKCSGSSHSMLFKINYNLPLVQTEKHFIGLSIGIGPLGLWIPIQAAKMNTEKSDEKVMF
jgi:hypothetical protein